jgi:hypothetical protein
MERRFVLVVLALDVPPTLRPLAHRHQLVTGLALVQIAQPLHVLLLSIALWSVTLLLRVRLRLKGGPSIRRLFVTLRCVLDS